MPPCLRALASCSLGTSAPSTTDPGQLWADTLRDGTLEAVAEMLRALDVPLIVASAYSRPELIGGKVLAGAPNVGKPTEERRLLALLEQFGN